MKKFLAVLVALGLCGLYWLGCQKKQAVTEPETPAAEMAQPEAVMPPPPPAPEAPAEGEKAQ